MTSPPAANANLVGFDGRGAAVKASFPVGEVAEAFRRQFDKDWAKRSRKLSLQAQVTVEGNFVRIDEGSRFLRWLLTWIAGHAVVEIEGRFSVNGQPVDSFHFTQKYGFGLAGGNSKSMVLCGAEALASRVVDTVVGRLRKHGQ